MNLSTFESKTIGSHVHMFTPTGKRLVGRKTSDRSIAWEGDEEEEVIDPLYNHGDPLRYVFDGR